MSYRILVVEDNPINQKVTIGLLQQAGFMTDLAVDGLEAIQAFRSKPFDLVVMDCQMPRCDGWAATRAIRKLEAMENSGRRLPIIALTAQALTGDREKCIASGMDDYLTKPVDRELFIQSVRFRLGLTAEEPQAAVVPGTDADLAPDAEGQPLLDPVVIENLKQYGAATVVQIFGLLLKDLPGLRDRLQQAITQGDLELTAKTAHRIKGGCGTVGVIALTRAMDHLERQARAADLAGIIAAWPAHESLINASIAAIEPLGQRGGA
jgi:two-component system, sensor histidine kinase and response regulator